MKTLFVERLLNKLIQEGKILEAITIPYLLRAYKIKDRDNTSISKEYIQYVFRHIVEDNNSPFFIRTCSTINQLTIKQADLNEKKEFKQDMRYKHISNEDGKPIIYFEIHFDCSNPTIENISEFFWDKYNLSCFIPQKYSYENSSWSRIGESEEQIIEQL